MSSAVQSPSFPSPSPAASPYIAQHSASFHVFQAATPNGLIARAESVSASEAPTPNVPVKSEPEGAVKSQNQSQAETRQEPVKTVDVEAVREEVWRRGKQKGRRPEEVETMAETAARIAERLAADHAVVLHPDVDTPFIDAEDVVRRLLPYHIYQHPMEDLMPLAHPHGKGKRKATEEELLRQEIEETRFALHCWKRKAALEKRFRAIRTRAGRRSAPDDQTYLLEHAVLEADRAENNALNNEYRTAKAEFDAADRKRKLALMSQPLRIPGPPQASASTSASTSARPSPHPATNGPPSYAVAASTPTYAVTASAGATQPYSANSPYTQYRGYTYPYPQTYGTPYTYTPYPTAANQPGYTAPHAAYAQQPSQNAFQGTQTTSGTGSSSSLGSPNPGGTQPVSEQARIPTPAANPAPAPAPPAAAPSQTSPAPASDSTITGPIPIMLPVGALGTLSSMGIIPVAAANVPPAGEAQPAAVIKGTTQNGTMVKLEINVSALQATQAEGLTKLLDALTAISTSRASAATPSAGTAEVGTEEAQRKS
ncbi:hypothetical protein EIP86_003351 [Pleurotus ostreatoroseus]|nr:hypothetical protein EIP86_003351 [Pleurotus ostreatoroseus]